MLHRLMAPKGPVDIYIYYIWKGRLATLKISVYIVFVLYSGLLFIFNTQCDCVIAIISKDIMWLKVNGRCRLFCVHP